MKVLITGATGFVGHALALRLLRGGHQVVAWSRSATRARQRLGSGPEIASPADGEAALEKAVDGCDAIVNLAGENLFGGRWTRERKRRLVDSRVETTAALVQAIGKANRRPGVLVSASAVGYYGSPGEAAVDESSPAADDFLAHLCVAWEAEAARAREHGVRVVTPRIGVVLGAGGGALETMLPVYKMGMGGVLGSGRQYMSWIHLWDVVEVIQRALSDARFDGPYNLTAPNPVPQSELNRALGAVLDKPAFMRVPGPALKLALGEASQAVLTSQRVLPTRLQDLGYQFVYPSVQEALGAILASAELHFTRPDSWPESDYLNARPPTYLLQQTARLDAPIDDVWQFFASPANLGAITPPKMDFRILSDVGEDLDIGSLIDYSFRIGGVRLRWRTRIDAWEDGQRFVDSQLKGPYASWWHEHRFAADGDATVVEDRVYYRPPVGVLGRMVHPFAVKPQLENIFTYRNEAMHLRFGPEPQPAHLGREAA